MIELIDRQEINCLALLREAEKKVSRLDAEILLSDVLGVNRSGLYVYEREITEGQQRPYRFYVERRSKGVPLQYILGKTEFMGLEFEVNSSVLIPRPETELLVEEAVRILRDGVVGAYSHTPLPIKPRNKPLILDLGTGCGNIAIALTKSLADCKIIGSDISGNALLTARRNARLNEVSQSIEFVISDLFNGFSSEKFDIIVSNPPYVASPELESLQEELQFEPRIALDGGLDGLDFYRRIIKKAGSFLNKNGILMFELGFGQHEYVSRLLIDNDFSGITFASDHNNIKRTVIAKWTD